MSENTNKPKFNLFRELYELMDSVILSAVFVLIIFTFFCRIFVVSGPSMLPTLESGDRLIVSDLFYEPAQGDIICFYSDRRDEILVKRVIATEGQTVNITNDHRVFVDGVELTEDYLGDVITSSKSTPMPYTVEADHVFVMGDNRLDSLDSRYTDIGTVDENDILGRLIVRLFPNFGKVE